MKKSALAVAALLGSLASASVIPAAYADNNVNSGETTTHQGCTHCKCACNGQGEECKACGGCEANNGCAGCSAASESNDTQTCSGYSGS